MQKVATNDLKCFKMRLLEFDHNFKYTCLLSVIAHLFTDHFLIQLLILRSGICIYSYPGGQYMCMYDALQYALCVMYRTSSIILCATDCIPSLHHSILHTGRIINIIIYQNRPSTDCLIIFIQILALKTKIQK